MGAEVRWIMREALCQWRATGGVRAPRPTVVKERDAGKEQTSQNVHKKFTPLSTSEFRGNTDPAIGKRHSAPIPLIYGDRGTFA